MIPDPPIYRETHNDMHPLTSWYVITGLSKLSEADRRQDHFDAVNAVNHGWTTAAAA